MIHIHILSGCAPTPLAHYLKALGILRLIAEQKDPAASGAWQDEQFVLKTRLTEDEIDEFFLHEYIPTPIVAPWNGGSGFYPNDNKDGIDPLSRAKAGRLKPYKDVIILLKNILGSRTESPKDEEKAILIARIRAILPDIALKWLDASVILTSEKPSFPPLLGTGGNDGRLDFSNNFMQRIVELFDIETGNPKSPHTTTLLRNALYEEVASNLLCKSIGQYLPGGIGGPNATTGFNANSLINPWDYILMLEGALLFAGSTTRRLESTDIGAVSCPFTVKATGTGSGSSAIADEADARAEIWVPLWQKPVQLPELTTFLSEGRVTLGRRLAKDGLDFARAISSFGTDRGISHFQRYAFLMRSGKAYLATPLQRIQVVRNPYIDLIAQLDRNDWLYRLRRFARDKNAPGRLQQLTRRLEDKIFSLIQTDSRSAIQDVLIVLGNITQFCTESSKTREAVTPIPILEVDWCLKSNDNSPEFHIACALASVHEMRSSVFPITQKSNSQKYKWCDSITKNSWGYGELPYNIISVMERRMLNAQSDKMDKQDFHPFAGNFGADIEAVIAFLYGKTDDGKIDSLLKGLLNVRPARLPLIQHQSIIKPPIVFNILKLLFTPDKIFKKYNLLPSDATLPLPREILSLLKAQDMEQTKRALVMAWRRLQIAKLDVPKHPKLPPDLIGIDSKRLAASLLIPLAIKDLLHICKPFKPALEAPQSIINSENFISEEDNNHGN